MRGVVLPTIFFLAATGFALSQDIEKCDSEVLLTTSKNLGSLSQWKVYNFLQTIGKECRTNVEFSDWSNELLFSVLNRHTEMTLIVLFNKEKRLDIDEIFDALASPVSDAVNIPSLIAKVELTNPVNPMRDRAIEALRIAQSKF